MLRNQFQHLSDEALLDYYHTTRNLRAFRHLYARHKDSLYRYCAQINLAAAGAVLEELWKNILERPPQLCGRLLRSWLFIRADRLLRDAAAESPDASAGDAAPDDKLPGALQKLPRIERNVLLLHLESRLPLATIADIERISLKKCREYYRSGREKIEEILHGPLRRPWQPKEAAP